MDDQAVNLSLMRDARLREQAKIQNELRQLSGLDPEQIARRIDRRCLHCGELITPIIREFTDWRNRPRRTTTWPDKHGCEPEAKALVQLTRQEESARQAQARRDFEAKLAAAGLVGWLAEATMDNYRPRQDWPGVDAVRARVISYRENYGRVKDNWLIMHGGFGMGKSHLAAALVRHALEHGRRAYFRVWTDYLKRLTATYDRRYEGQETEADIITELQRGDLVVIDDLDKRDSDFTRTTLYTVLNHRYNEQLPTVLTFNYGPEDISPHNRERLILQDFLGGAVLDRILGVTYDVIEFGGPSFRSGVELKPDK